LETENVRKQLKTSKHILKIIVLCIENANLQHLVKIACINLVENPILRQNHRFSLIIIFLFFFPFSFYFPIELDTVEVNRCSFTAPNSDDTQKLKIKIKKHT